MAKCDRCKLKEAFKGWMYCTKCKKSIIKELKEVGYLTKLPSKRTRNTEYLDRIYHSPLVTKTRFTEAAEGMNVDEISGKIEK